MTSTFAKIVKAQRVDQKDKRARGFDGQTIYTLADRARRGDLKVAKRLRSPFGRFMRLWWLVVKFVTRWRVLQSGHGGRKEQGG